MKMFKKIISILICVAMLMTINGVAFAAEDSTSKTPVFIDDTHYMIDDVLFEELLTDDGQYMLTTSVDGKLVDRVTIELGKDEFVYETFNDVSLQNNSKESTKQILYLSDFITYNSVDSNTNMQLSSGYTKREGNLGTVLYQAYEGGNFVYHLLSFNSVCMKESLGIETTVSGEPSIAWSVLIAALGAALGTAFPGLAATIILAGGGAAIGYLGSSFSIEVTGDAYKYNVTATTNDGTSRTSTRGGAEYYGTILSSEGVYINNQTIYNNYYPSFKLEQDTFVAITFFQDLFSATQFSVYSW